MNFLSSLLERNRMIRSLPVFSKLSWFDAQRVSSKASVVHYPKGEVLYRQGDPANGFYCIVSGRVQAYRMDAQGRKGDMEFFRRGMYFGIVSMLTGSAHSMTFEAINDSQVLFIAKEHFDIILKSIPQLGLEFSQSLSLRLQQRSSSGGKSVLNRIISVYSPVKQAGSSTYAFHLAHQISRQAKAQVIAIQIASALPSADNDPVSDRTQAAPQWKTRGRHLDEVIGQEAVIRSLVSRVDDGLDMLPVCFYPDDRILVSRISDFVTSMAMDYDYVVVDLPNDMDDVVMKTLTQSDEVHLIAHDDARELHMIRHVLNVLEETLKENFDPRDVRVMLKTQQGVEPFAFERIREILDYDVYARLPYVADDELERAIDVQIAWVRFPVVGCPFAQEIVKIARDVSGVRIGLVLGGGAALGIAHIGVLRVLEREHIPVDIIAGSSMGALVAALWVSGYDAECLAGIAEQFRDQRSMLKLFDPVIPISGVIGGRLIKRWLYRFLGDKHFYDARLPLYAVAYDLNNRQELVYESGRLIDAVRKSISIPGVFEPVIEDDRVIIDGGVLNPVPTNVLRKAGVNKIIAVNVLQSPDEVIKGYEAKRMMAQQNRQQSFFSSPLKFLAHRLTRRRHNRPRPTISDIMVQTLLASEYEVGVRSAQDADVLIHPDLAGIQWYELYRVDDLIRRGEVAADKALPEIRALVERHEKNRS